MTFLLEFLQMLMGGFVKIVRGMFEWFCIAMFAGCFVFLYQVNTHGRVFEDFAHLANGDVTLEVMTVCCLFWGFWGGYYLFLKCLRGHSIERTKLHAKDFDQDSRCNLL